MGAVFGAAQDIAVLLVLHTQDNVLNLCGVHSVVI